MEIINAHAHVYPDNIAKKATNAIGKFYDLPMNLSEGTIRNLIEDGKKIGVSKYVVHSVATTAHQVRAINEFIKNQMQLHDELIGFITLHPELSDEEIVYEINWAVENGFKGIKLHPDFQKFYIDEDKAQRIYKLADDKLPFLIHVGDSRFEFSKPQRLVTIAKKFPKTNFICAHMGGYQYWDQAGIFLGLDNVYFDTCSSLAFISPAQAKEMISLLGAEKFFFATDFPMWKSEDELKRFLDIDLNDNERQMILSKNIKNLLKIN